MILQVIDGGRFEKIAIRGVPSREIEGHYKEDYPVISIRDCVTDEIVFDGLGYEWIKISNPFVDIQTRSS